MFALIQSGVVVAVNKTGFDNAVLSKVDEIIEHDSPEMGKLWDGKTFTTSNESLAKDAQKHAIEQLNKADVELVLTGENSSRAKYTIAELVTYKEALRDYVRGEDGVLVISTEKPEINGGIL